LILRRKIKREGREVAIVVRIADWGVGEGRSPNPMTANRVDFFSFIYSTASAM
jgi:hypothetical protein